MEHKYVDGFSYIKSNRVKTWSIRCFDASPPCQGFSGANVKAEINDVKNYLFIRTIGLIAEIQPKVFLIENVKGLTQGRKKAFFEKIKKMLNRLNYTWKHTIANASHYGVPQERERIVIVGVRNDIINLIDNPEFIPLPDLTKVHKMNLNSVLPGVAACSPGQFMDTIRFSNRPVCTITKTASLWLYDNDGTRRRPTIKELKILSSFPTEFKFVGSYLNQWARIGNAVPPKLINAFAVKIKEQFLNERIRKLISNTTTIEECTKISEVYTTLLINDTGEFNIVEKAA